MSGETFETLLASNLTLVRRLIQSRLKGADQTDDVVQQTLLHAFAHRDQLREQSRFKSWLCSIAMNEIRSLRRSHKPGISLEEFANVQFAAGTPSPFAQTEQAERARRLEAGLARLSRRDRTAIHLVDLTGLTMAEAARKLAVSTGAFKSTYFRARQRLADALRRMPSLARPRLVLKGKQTSVHQFTTTYRNDAAHRIAA